MESTEKPHDSRLKVLCLVHVFKALIYCIISVFLRNNKRFFCVSASSWVPSIPSQKRLHIGSLHHVVCSLIIEIATQRLVTTILLHVIKEAVPEE